MDPDDIDNYKVQSLSSIKNECNPRSYEWELFPKEIAANQLKQAGGTCYLVSALESLSHIPNILEYLFPNGNNFSSDDYSFIVQFYGMNNIKGESTSLVIKNEFPVDKKNELMFMKLLEKEA